MAELIFHDSAQIESVFQLIGDQENDITKSIAWILKECPPIMTVLLEDLCSISPNTDTTTIYYQRFEKVNKRNTYTDLEITDDSSFHIILEAKRGWELPGADQLIAYSTKQSFFDTSIPIKRIFSISECSNEYADKNLPFKVTPNGIPVEHISWKYLKEVCIRARKFLNNHQKNLLDEFIVYLEGISTMRNTNSNSVYVVSLSDNEAGNGHSYIDVIKLSNHYYCPVSWFKNQNNIPNYIAFRYFGQLQSIHHIDGYIITKNMHDKIEFMPDTDWEDEHYIFDLGPAIIPPHVVTNGKSIRWANRVYADLDTLLTCDTITEAMLISQARRGEQN